MSGVPATVRRVLHTPARRIAAAAVVLVLLIVVAVAVWPSSAPTPVASQDETITVAGGPGVDTPVDLDATLYLPAVTPAPAVIMAHGFGGSKRSVAADAQDMARAGFVVLAYSARGFGNSTGQIGLDSLDYEIADARGLVDWLAARPEVQQDGPDDPRVGVTGASYGGALSLMLAGTDPRIDALAPSITWNDLSQALFPNAQADDGDLTAATPAAATGSTDGVFKQFWASALVTSVTTGVSLSGQSIASGDSGDSGFVGGRRSESSASAAPTAEPTEGDPAAAPSSAGDAPTSAAPTTSAAATPSSGGQIPGASAATPTCGRLMLTLCAAYAQAAETGRINPELQTLLERSSPAQVVGDITAPTLLVQGERDTLFGLDQADANARAIAANGATVAVSWYNGGHDGGSPDTATENRITDWFRYYLAGTGTEPSTAFRYTVDGPVSDTGSARSRTLQADSYPGLTGGTTDRFDIPLSGDPQFAVNPPGGVPAGISTLPGLSGLASTALTTFAGGLPGQTARFSSAPMTALTILTGTPRVTVSVSGFPVPSLSGADPSTDGAVLFASLAKVTAGGTRTLAGGAVAPIRITDLPADGTPVDVTVDLPATAFQVEAGSTVEVSLSTTDQAFAGPTSPAAYRIALSDTAVADGPAARTLSAPEVQGTRVSASEIPIGYLVGLIVLAVVVVLALALGGRVRRRAADIDPALVDVPLSIVGLAKRYPGGVAAVQDVSFRVEAGQVLGLLGPNGAGKTTSLRMVMGLIAPTAGEIRVFGRRIAPGAEILSRIGSFVEGSGFLPHLSGKANLDLYWRATGRPAEDAHMDVALEIAGLGKAVDRRVRTYSQGMRQRLAIAQAMLGLPELLLLDEPTNGLDPPQIHAMREVLRRYAATGRTVLVSSHLLSEVEQTCSHVVVVNKGRTIAAGTVAELVSSSGEMVFAVDDAERTAALLRDDFGITGVEVTEAGVQADLDRTPPSRVLSALVGAGIAVNSMAPRNRLEDVFLDLVGENGDGTGSAPMPTPGGSSSDQTGARV
ncbi:alpha/beta fold hydrolase [Nakamurella flavida]|uniref:Alpha/beta fold hydrolase n=1 Tax=Nakamurella flavida TaxID=363630 RepID=A0A938YM77_9ACTN|nr:alpha/beta fold hydrolase [Nakamurella flavida]MBM9475432.1 alpha/beta fold hydrolase [Nakamurella flavida]MBM9475480.1 alpha/beta fold hydrolase [Nakamurella flavida]MDP9777012.1 ABC-2 type transport system ATP-binding protein [Nakamurella flavida]